MTFHAGTPERRVVYAYEGEVDALRAEIERLKNTMLFLLENDELTQYGRKTVEAALAAAQ
jgi:hypothetical protein